jgi:hypothetical protein
MKIKVEVKVKVKVKKVVNFEGLLPFLLKRNKN